MAEGPLGGPRPFTRESCSLYIQITPGNQKLSDRDMVEAVKDVILDPSVQNPEEFIITLSDAMSGADYILVNEAKAEEAMPGFDRGGRPPAVSFDLLDFYREELNSEHNLQILPLSELSSEEGLASDRGKIEVKCGLTDAEEQAFDVMGAR